MQAGQARSDAREANLPAQLLAGRVDDVGADFRLGEEGLDRHERRARAEHCDENDRCENLKPESFACHAAF